MKRIVVREPGGPDRMTLVDVPTPTPGPNEALVAIAVSGVNFIDIYFRSVGQTTFDKSLRTLRPRGLMVLFGQSSGAVPPFDPALLSPRGSLFLTRPNLAHYLATREELLWRTGELFPRVLSGALKVRIAATYLLADAAKAHRDLESRKTAGKLLLKVR